MNPTFSGNRMPNFATTRPTRTGYVPLLALVYFMGVLPVLAADVPPLLQAHAHNDYYHRRPLLDALEHGFCGVEADLFLVDGELLVGHSRSELQADRQFEGLYLKPLAERVVLHRGSVHAQAAPFTLLVDLKTEGVEAYRVLHDQLSRYGSMLTHVENGELRPGPVTVIVSGDRPIAAITASNPRYVGIDGRLSDLDSTVPSHLMPMISDNWRNHFQWRGEGPISEAEQVKLTEIIAKSHRAGRRVRFWATPESPALWQVLRESEVDVINTDELAKLRDFLQASTSHAR